MFPCGDNLFDLSAITLFGWSQSHHCLPSALMLNAQSGSLIRVICLAPIGIPACHSWGRHCYFPHSRGERLGNWAKGIISVSFGTGTQDAASLYHYVLKCSKAINIFSGFFLVHTYHLIWASEWLTVLSTYAMKMFCVLSQMYAYHTFM